MSWISKNLTLDLIAIAIDALSRTFERIKQEPDGGWPPAEPEAQPVIEQQTPMAPSAAVKEEAEPEPTPEPEPEPEPQVDTAELHSQAQTVLRGISLDEGPDWIVNVLFPHFSVTSLTDVPADRLPELIAMAQAHVDQKEAA